MVEKSLFSIVVIGNMNPSIHHPTWYQLTNIISKKEETFAIENKDLVCTPQFSKLITYNYRIHCVTDRWEILTEDEKKSDLILKVAADTFKHLSETPIIAYGFNFNFQRETKCKNIGEIASKLMINLNIGFPDSLGTSTFSYSWIESQRRTSVTIKPTKNLNNVISVSINMHYDIKDMLSTSQKVRFELDDFLTKYYSDDKNDAYSIVSDIIKKFEQQEV